MGINYGEYQPISRDYSSDFIPIIELDLEQSKSKGKYSYTGFEIERETQTIKLSKHIDSDKVYQKVYNIKMLQDEIVVRFKVVQANNKATDNDGYIEIKPYGVTIKTKNKIETKYGHYIAMRISANEIKNNAYIDFYAHDNGIGLFDSLGLTHIHCGRVMIGKQRKCFCNEDFTVEEFRNIVIGLRKKEVYIKNGKLLRDKDNNPILKNNKRQYVDRTQYDELGEKLFHLDYPEKIVKEEANFNSFTEAINKTLKDYEINTCIRKIHFLAQCYHETQRFTLTYEKKPNSNVKGGSFYRGRGLIQLTHDYNYKKLKEKLKDTSNINDFVPKVAKNIDVACQASGYYWKHIGAKDGNINQFADKDDILTVSREINGYVKEPNGLKERILFTNLLKEIMNYASCQKNK